jgi:hypothetical protein
VLGHFTEEISFLSSKATNMALKVVLKIVYFLTPNLQFFNLRDFWDVPHIVGSWLFVPFGYCAVYSAFCIVMSIWVFKKKEF